MNSNKEGLRHVPGHFPASAMIADLSDLLSKGKSNTVNTELLSQKMLFKPSILNLKLLRPVIQASFLFTFYPYYANLLIKPSAVFL